jgi:hypothetical protein
LIVMNRYRPAVSEAAPAVEVHIQRSIVIIDPVGVPSGRVGLPDLDQRGTGLPPESAPGR